MNLRNGKRLRERIYVCWGEGWGEGWLLKESSILDVSSAPSLIHFSTPSDFHLHLSMDTTLEFFCTIFIWPGSVDSSPLTFTWSFSSIKPGKYVSLNTWLPGHHTYLIFLWPLWSLLPSHCWNALELSPQPSQGCSTIAMGLHVTYVLVVFKLVSVILPWP